MLTTIAQLLKPFLSLLKINSNRRDPGVKPAANSNTMDPVDLRRAFGRFGTGVTVITSRAPDGRRLGVTANSFNTVSLSPPIVLWSLSDQSPSLASFRAAGRFVVNVLALDQVGLSQRFSRPAADKFAGVACSESALGMPLLDGCAATIECTIIDIHAVGDHMLFLGQVERYAYEQAAPLLFCNGQYHRGVELHAPKGMSDARAG